MERLYDYDVDTSSSILESYRDDDKEKKLIDSFLAFKIAYSLRSKDGFGFSDFTDLTMGKGFIEDIRKQEVSNTRERINQLKANGQNY